MADTTAEVSERVINRRRRASSNRHCCVPQCTNDSRYDPDGQLSFHALPSDQKLRKLWLWKIRRDEGPYFKITKSTVVCSAHFLPSDYKRSLTGIKRDLTRGAVPSVFSFNTNTPSSQQQQNRRKSPKKRANLKEPELPSADDEDMVVLEAGETEIVSEMDTLVPAYPDHDYAVKPASATEQLDAAQQKILELEDALAREKSARFSFERFAGCDAKIKKYTGFRNHALFQLVFSVLQPTACNMIRWSQFSRNNGVLGICRLNVFRNETLPLIDQFFMVLCRLKVGFDEETLSDLFLVSQSTVSRILITWINYLYCILGSITVWPSQTAVKERMPEVFRKCYPNTRVILDCSEIKVQTPSSKVLNSMTYSYYKGTTTYKSLVGISPDGSVTFVSCLYTGSISDKDITIRSGIVDLLEEGDEVMVDKGFIISDLLAKKKANLVIPPFLGQDKQFTSSEVMLTQDIARLRVHVERAIRRVKEFKILQQVIPLTLAGSINQLWTVSALLTNFRGRLY